MTPEAAAPYRETQDAELRVSAATDVGKLAKSISMSVRESATGHIKVRAMGPHAVNQAIKGIIVARQVLAGTGQDLLAVPAFDVPTGPHDLTVIVLNLELVTAHG